MDYKIVVVGADSLTGTNFEHAAENLAGKVREEISLGWEPLGGVAIGRSTHMNKPHLFQALIKRR